MMPEWDPGTTTLLAQGGKESKGDAIACLSCGDVRFNLSGS